MALKKKTTFKLGERVRIEVDPKSDEVQVYDREGGRPSPIKKTELWALLFAVADEKTQDELMPVRKTQIMKFERVHTVQLTKSLKRGQLLTVKCVVDVDKTVRDAIANGTGGVKE